MRAETERLAHLGATGHLAGAAAELRVAQLYERRGAELLHLRWRGAAGEIDLILREAGVLVFVEVKKSRSFARAAERVSPRQMARIAAAAEEFLGTQPLGQSSEMRFDVALMDGQGAIRLVENAFGGL